MTESKKIDSSIQKNRYFKKELHVLIPFIKRPWKSFTISEIKTALNTNSHNYVYDALEHFSKCVLLKEKHGSTNIYKINPDAVNLDPLILSETIIKCNSTHIPYTIFQVMQKKLKTSYYTLLVTGSFASRTQSETSDIDVAIIIPSGNKKPFEIALSQGELTIPEVHGFVFTEEEFYQMLINDSYNYGKECAKNHIILHGAEAYYTLLLRGLKNGFKG
ncbi:MAG: nucleotidyltransferase domain-containing protein [Candidatus Woesearchaeota archaeon]